MDTKWLAAAGVACVLAFGGVLYLATPSSDASVPVAKSDIKAPTVSRNGSGHKPTQAARSKGKGGKAAKGGKGAARTAKAGRGAKAGKAARTADPAAAAKKWDEMRAALADGIGAKLDAYAAEKSWDDAKKKSVQGLLDESLAKVDDVSAQIQAGTMSPEQAKTEFQTMKSDVARRLTELVGAEDAMGLVAELKAGRGGAAKRPAPRAP